MEVKFKKTRKFTVIKTLCFVVVTLFLAIGCDKSEILPENGDIDPALLVGKWDCIKFAYTANGKTFSDVSTLSKGRMEILNLENKWRFVHTNEMFYLYSISGNSIKLTMNGSTFIYPPQEETTICEALKNVYSFGIKGNELFFYFKGSETKNLLILKKQ